MGDRRGWLLALAHPLAIVGVVVIAALLIDGTRWMLVFPAVLVLFVVWFGQALNAHRQAVAMGSAPGGELQIALFLPVVVAFVTAFWLLGGSAGSPATMLRRYVAAWEEGKPETAAALFASPAEAAQLSAEWSTQGTFLGQRVAAASAVFGPQSGIDPEQPFNSLRFTELESTSPELAVVSIEIVRRQRVDTVLLGFIPTATQMTVVVERVGTVILRSLPAQPADWLPAVHTGSRVWRIDTVSLGTNL